MSKISAYPTTNILNDADILYVVQNSGGTNASKKVSFAHAMTKVNTKTSFTNGINLGVASQALTNSGTINTAGITALTLTAAGTFTLNAGTEGDEKVILIESNPSSFPCSIVGTFFGSVTSISKNDAGIVIRLLFHNGIWYQS